MSKVEDCTRDEFGEPNKAVRIRSWASPLPCYVTKCILKAIRVGRSAVVLRVSTTGLDRITKRSNGPLVSSSESQPSCIGVSSIEWCLENRFRTVGIL